MVCNEEGNDMGCCLCLPSYVGIIVFAVLTVVGAVAATARFAFEQEVAIKWEGMTDDD